MKTLFDWLRMRLYVHRTIYRVNYYQCITCGKRRSLYDSGVQCNACFNDEVFARLQALGYPPQKKAQ